MPKKFRHIFGEKGVDKMTWKNIVRKQERDMTFMGTEYADDNGDSITFYGSSRTKQATIPKSELNEAIDRYDAETGRTTKRLTQLTMSAGPTSEFTHWAMQNGYN